MPFELCEECDKLNLRIVANTRAMEMEVGSSLLQEIRRCQLEDENVQEMKRDIKEEKSHGFSEDNEGVLWYKGRICVPNIKELKDKILHDPSPPHRLLCRVALQDGPPTPSSLPLPQL
jgi:hypothetical protein